MDCYYTTYNYRGVGFEPLAAVFGAGATDTCFVSANFEIRFVYTCSRTGRFSWSEVLPAETVILCDMSGKLTERLNSWPDCEVCLLGCPHRIFVPIELCLPLYFAIFC